MILMVDSSSSTYSVSGSAGADKHRGALAAYTLVPTSYVTRNTLP